MYLNHSNDSFVINGYCWFLLLYITFMHVLIILQSFYIFVQVFEVFMC
jgi:hypothetical protein